jgi:zinc transporter ZupT
MKNKTKNIQTLSLSAGILFLAYGFFESILEHIDDFSRSNFIIIFSVFLFTYLCMTYFTHNHIHKSELKGLVMAEFLHSIIDGAVIGFAYFVNPLLGFGALLSVLGHEFPKIVGTYLIIISQVKNKLESLKYLVYTQVGLPFSAILFYFLGKEIGQKYHEYLEAIALASLFAIIIRLIVNTIKLHNHKH